MKKVVFIIFSIMLFIPSFAEDCFDRPKKPTLKEQKQFDKMMDDRMKFTDEQVQYIKNTRPKHRKEMEKKISQMEDLHNKIKNVYLLGIPKYQADIRTAPYKAQLAILKQEADKMRAENRKNFENILTKEQKEELEKIRKERALNRPPRRNQD